MLAWVCAYIQMMVAGTTSVTLLYVSIGRWCRPTVGVTSLVAVIAMSLNLRRLWRESSVFPSDKIHITRILGSAFTLIALIAMIAMIAASAAFVFGLNTVGTYCAR